MSIGVYDALGPEGFGVYEVDWSQGPSFRRVSKPPGNLLIPGFIDIHVHGAFGTDLMSATAQEMEELCRCLAAEGYEAFLPTTVSASAQDVQAMLGRLPDNPMILGFHLEGPFISPNFPGAQPQDKIVPAPEAESEWSDILSDPRLRIVTLAPEIPNALELITKLMERGVIVSMGHTDATYDEARRGYRFGAAHATHAFNAMRPFHHREAGFVGYMLHNPDLVAELIYDRIHVCKEAAELLLQVKTADNVIGISDGTMASGMMHGTKVEMWGQVAYVGHQDVRLEDGTIAGSAITVADAFRNLHDDFGAEVAIKLCCLNARRALGLSEAPKLWLEFDKKLRIVHVHHMEASPQE